MLIRKKLRLVVYLSTALLAVMAFMVFYTSMKVERAGRLNRLSSDLVKELTELRLLLFDSILHSRQISVGKWKTKQQFIAKTIESGIAMQTDETKEILGRIRQNILGVERLYAALDSLRQGHRTKEPSGELETRLIGQILIRSQLIVTDATLLDHRAVDSARALQRLQRRLLYVLILLICGGVALLVLYVNKGIVGSLDRLAEGARFISGGDLDHRIEFRGDDEIGAVGRDFNAMAVELKYMVLSLQRSEENLRLIIDASPIAVTAVDAEENVTLWNPAAEKMFGWQSAEVIGRSLPIIPEAMREDRRRLRQDVMRGKGIIAYETLCLHRYGPPIEVSISAALLRDAEARAVGVLTLIEDIGERKRTEEALRRSEERFRSTLDNMMEGCQIIGFDMRYLYVNNVAAVHGRRSKEELLGSLMTDVYPGIDSTPMFAALRKCLEDRLPLQMENEFIYPDGLRAWFQLAIQPVPEGIFVLSMDITERKKTDEELRLHREHLEDMVRERTSELQQSGLALMNIVEDLNQKTTDLEKANARLHEIDRLKSVFIASMSHELRTPLNSVIGFTSILLEEWIGPLNSEQKENLNTILQAGRHLLALINDVIDVSKVEAGVVDSSVSEFDVHDVITEAAWAFRKECGERGLVLQIESVHEVMHTDRRRLLQSVLNLLSNAVKFTERGSVRVTARRRRTGDSDEIRQVEISVEDTGIGIPEADMSKLFSPFTRLDSPLKDLVPGTGLGLYLTKKLVSEVLGGELEVASAAGEGSTFMLRVPVEWHAVP